MAAIPYDGVEPFPGRPPTTTTVLQRRVQVAVTALLVVAPLAGLVGAVWLLWGRGVGVVDLLLAGFFYFLTGFGVTVGFHRLLTHRSFTAAPALRTGLAVAGSMSFQGSVISWVATHRRHHAFTDRPGDPHSPYRYGTGPIGQLHGLVHAHFGWLFGDDPTDVDHFAPDLVAEPAMRRVAGLFPALCVASLALPALAGWMIGDFAWTAGLTALIWAGLARVFLLQHVTWSVNSLCHLLGTRPFATRKHDRATNLWPLAVLSMGESWHNTHHSDPSCARHGVDRGQIDLSAGVIRVFEKLGWATNVRWPDPRRLAEHRLQPATATGTVTAIPTSALARTESRASRDYAG
ncbi:stearoyl-CoA desaturase (delta-9 desaturase) [Catenulispora sp. GAS73]|uniref:acyl-CoA desaturase n=1 Tax=Catenulispora sp. GAS73 TaxID=3156269 RepID=UPI0035185421